MRFCRKIAALILFILAFAFPQLVQALSSSPNYMVNEFHFGNGGGSSSSATYKSDVALGGTPTGSQTSASYRAEVGFITANVPFLEMAITGPTVSFGVLSSNTTAYGSSQGGTCNCSFYVRTYLSSQYVVATMAQPPTSESGHIFTAKASQGAPSASTSVEEFGINLVANTIPGAMGAAAVNDPSNTFADGTVTASYNVANQYKYAVGDIIAQSPKTVGNAAVGQTDYTLSYIIKNSNTTPAGTYVMNQDIVATATY